MNFAFSFCTSLPKFGKDNKIWFSLKLSLFKKLKFCYVCYRRILFEVFEVGVECTFEVKILDWNISESREIFKPDRTFRMRWCYPKPLLELVLTVADPIKLFFFCVFWFSLFSLSVLLHIEKITDSKLT